MKLVKSLFILFVLSIFLIGCSRCSEVGNVLRNQKNNTTDEFLVKKKEPLIQPPDFESILEPGSIKKTGTSAQNRMEKILKAPQTQSSTYQSKSTSTEESILREIKK